MGGRNSFAVWTTIAVVAAFAVVVAIVVWMNTIESDPEAMPGGAAIDEASGTISFGTGPDVVETYVDFFCPVCAAFEDAEGETITELIDDEAITLKVHPVAILDRLSQGSAYSSRSAASMYAVAEADPAHAYAYLQALFANQPPENTTGLSDEELIALARGAGVEVTSALEEAIRGQKYLAYAQSQELPDGASGTPALVVNGDLVPVSFDPQSDIVDRLAG